MLMNSKRLAFEEASRQQWLSETESKVLSFILRYQEKHKRFPRLVDIQNELNLTEYKVRRIVLYLDKQNFIEYKVRRWGIKWQS